MKKILEKCYFFNKEKIPFVRNPPEYNKAEVKITSAFLMAIISTIALVVLVWLLCNDLQNYDHVFTDSSSSPYFIPIVVLALAALFNGPILIVAIGPHKYFGTIKKMFTDTFLIDEKRRFKSTINQLMEVFGKIAEDLEKHNRIVHAVNEDSNSSQNLWLGKVFLYHLHRVAGILSVRQSALEKNDIPLHVVEVEILEMLELARLGSFCNLINPESAKRGEIFKHKIIHQKDWLEAEMEPPPGFRPSPES